MKVGVVKKKSFDHFRSTKNSTLTIFLLEHTPAKKLFVGTYFRIRFEEGKIFHQFEKFQTLVKREKNI